MSVQKRIEQTEKKEVRIPIGALFKNDLFAFYGPKIKFKMAPAGNVFSSYRSEFSAAGINQTRHIIYLDVKASVQVVIPLARNSVVVNSSIPIAESIIVGKVPDTYANIDGLNSSNNQNQKNVITPRNP
ncbi:sporulation protein YunB [Fervidicella metallireducens]|uniref:sporulation protein YunB n=1 Tax=Fervidicella metallireducens TaxID=655338 RepID=UPI0006882A71|nr:sporulation protein YunB [Fervidicella metallireducens]